MSGIITLTTDWGYGDPYAAIFRANVWRLRPDTVVTDISHQVCNSSRLHAGYLLSSACWFFPEGTVHVVDVREISTMQFARIANRERPLPFLDFLGVRCNGHFFLMENNGILSLVDPDFANVEEVVKLRRHPDFEQYYTFNALAYYAYASAMLASGSRLSELGEVYGEDELERLSLPGVIRTENRLEGRVQHIDARGNLITDIRREDWASVAAGRKKVSVQVEGSLECLEDVRLYNHYLQIGDGICFALFNTSGFLEIGQKNVSLAAMLYGIEDVVSGIGDVVTLRF